MGSLVEFSKLWCSTVPEGCYCEDPDEMQHYAAFQLGLHCVQKYPFRGVQYIKG